MKRGKRYRFDPFAVMSYHDLTRSSQWRNRSLQALGWRGRLLWEALSFRFSPELRQLIVARRRCLSSILIVHVAYSLLPKNVGIDFKTYALHRSVAVGHVQNAGVASAEPPVVK